MPLGETVGKVQANGAEAVAIQILKNTIMPRLLTPQNNALSSLTLAHSRVNNPEKAKQHAYGAADILFKKTQYGGIELLRFSRGLMSYEDDMGALTNQIIAQLLIEKGLATTEEVGHEDFHAHSRAIHEVGFDKTSEMLNVLSECGAVQKAIASQADLVISQHSETSEKIRSLGKIIGNDEMLLDRSFPIFADLKSGRLPNRNNLIENLTSMVANPASCRAHRESNHRAEDFTLHIGRVLRVISPDNVPLDRIKEKLDPYAEEKPATRPAQTTSPQPAASQECANHAHHKASNSWMSGYINGVNSSHQIPTTAAR